VSALRKIESQYWAPARQVRGPVRSAEKASSFGCPSQNGAPGLLQFANSEESKDRSGHAGLDARTNIVPVRNPSAVFARPTLRVFTMFIAPTY
jgi:hypothetical protein